jgi:predicted metal-dependent enzyme (double-stranded beta helix superfamily)
VADAANDFESDAIARLRSLVKKSVKRDTDCRASAERPSQSNLLLHLTHQAMLRLRHRFLVFVFDP